MTTDSTTDAIALRLREHLDLTAMGLPADAGAADLAAYWRARPATGIDVARLLTVPAVLDDYARTRAAETALHRILPREMGFSDLGYAPHDYGETIDWDAKPYDQAIYPSCMHRMDWDWPLAAVYLGEGDGICVSAWQEITGQWLARYGYGAAPGGARAWLALEPAVRSVRWCADFDLYHGAAELEDAYLLAFVDQLGYHGRHMSANGSPWTNNCAVAYARGLIYVSACFPEFRDSDTWLAAGMQQLRAAMDAQITPDGVQLEGINYHSAVAGLLFDLVDLLEVTDRLDLTRDGWLLERLEAMCFYTAAVISPNRSYPMFSDARRPSHEDRLEKLIARGVKQFGHVEWSAIYADDPAAWPAWTSRSFAAGGMYMLRSDWSREAVYVALHCGPHNSSHNHPDNGGFELHAYGKWLVPDSGCYAYGHGHAESKLRPWFAATHNHQCMTLNGENQAFAARHLQYRSIPGLVVVTVENVSYPGLAHRRTLFFVRDHLVVLYDEGIGQAEGEVALHVQLMPGPATIDVAAKRIITTHDEGANIAFWQAADPAITMTEEEGWTSGLQHQRTERPAVACRHAATDGKTPRRFLSAFLPTPGPVDKPLWELRAEPAAPGASRVTIHLTRPGESLIIWRDLDGGTTGLG